VRGLQYILSLALVALLPIATVHCKLENFPVFQFLSCDIPDDTASHEGDDCDADGCELVENGFYKIEDSQIQTDASPLFARMIVPPALDTRPLSVTPQFSPALSPELPVTWQFFFRAAAPPRAPSFVS